MQADQITIKQSQMSIEEFKSKIASATTSEAITNLVAEAFYSKRLDLVRECFYSPLMFTEFFTQFEKEPASQFKNEVVLMMLREPWPFDESPGQPPKPGSRPPPTTAYMCINVLKQYMPEEKFDANDPATVQRFFNLESRLKIAALFEKAITEKAKEDGQKKTNP